jgi:hypothetical protein
MSNTEIGTFSSMLDRIGDITVSNVIDVVNDEKGTRKVLNVRSLVKSLVTDILALTDVSDIKTDPDDVAKVKGFLNNIASAVEKFCDFLDYDGDGKVELVQRNEKGEIVVGEDIELMEKDVDTVKSAFKNRGDVATTLLAIVSTLFMYFTGARFTSTKDDFLNFKTACENAYASYNLIKSIDHSKFLKENSKDMMRFIVMMCVLVVPIIDLVSHKITEINKDSDTTNGVVSQADIHKIVKETYGLNLEFILKAVNNLVDIFLKGLHTKGKQFLAFLKKKCCCGASSTA